MILTAFDVASCDPQLNAPIQLPANLAAEGCAKSTIFQVEQLTNGYYVDFCARKSDTF